MYPINPTNSRGLETVMLYYTLYGIVPYAQFFCPCTAHLFWELTSFWDTANMLTSLYTLLVNPIQLYFTPWAIYQLATPSGLSITKPSRPLVIFFPMQKRWSISVTPTVGEDVMHLSADLSSHKHTHMGNTCLILVMLFVLSQHNPISSNNILA